MFSVMARKNKLAVPEDAVPEVDPARGLSGADIESVVLAAKRRMMTAGRQQASRDDLDQRLAEFIPAAQGLVKKERAEHRRRVPSNARN